jgi:methyl-accepting chemotaxis protein
VPRLGKACLQNPGEPVELYHGDKQFREFAESQLMKERRMVANMRLGTKITLGFFSLIAITMVLGGLALWSMREVRQASEHIVNVQIPEMGITRGIESTALHTMFEARGYAYTEERPFLDAAQACLVDLKGNIARAKEHAAQNDMPALGENAGRAETKLKEYEQLLNDSTVCTEGMTKNRTAMDTAAAAYLAECENLYKAQEAGLEKDCAEMRKWFAQKGQAADFNEIATRVHERFGKVKDVAEILATGNAMRIQCWKAMATRDAAGLRQATGEFDKIDAVLDRVKSVTRQEVNLRTIERCSAANHAYREAMTSYIQNWATREEQTARRVAASNAVLDLAGQTFEQGMQETTVDAAAAAKSLSSASTTLFAGLVVAIAVAIVLAIFLTRGITRPIRRIIVELTDGAEQVASASGQVSAASQSLAEGATEQAAGLEETSSSLEEVSSMTKQNADNAQQANTLAAEANRAAATGSESMGRMNAAIHEIQKSSDETSKIIKVIDEIAFQTNLLALNAAVEAARAGEAGKGFAVVAEEVRNLAMRSAEAAKNTASMIEESVKNSGNGVDIAAEVSKVLEEIVQSVGKTTNLVGEIAAASQEQAQGIDQVNTAVSQMDKITQQNAANAEESASASEELSAQAESMKEIVSQLVAMVGSSSSDMARPGTAKSDRHDVRADIESQLHRVAASKSKPRSFGKSDEVLHRIAGPDRKAQSAASKSAGEATIPLNDNEGDLKKFNG